MVYVGIDISKDSFSFCLINAHAQILQRGELPQSQEGFAAFLAILREQENPTLLLESSGRYHIPLTAFLLNENFFPFVINPKFTHRFHQFIAATNPAKSDAKDAFTLALFALKYSELLQPSSISSSAKILARTILELKHRIAETKTQILNCLAVLFPEIEKHGNIFSKAFLNLLLAFPSAKAIAQAQDSSLRRVLEGSSRGPKPSLTPRAVKELAQSSIGISHGGYEVSLKLRIRELFFLEENLRQLEAHLEEEMRKHGPSEEQLLSSIKGISSETARLFLAEVEDVGRFKSARALTKYAGTDPVVKQSGKYRKEKGISKQGNPHLRNILYQMATGVVMWNEVFRAYFQKKKAQFGSYRKAMIATVNKLIRVVWAMLTKKETFMAPKVAPSARIIVEEKHVILHG